MVSHWSCSSSCKVFFRIAAALVIPLLATNAFQTHHQRNGHGTSSHGIIPPAVILQQPASNKQQFGLAALGLRQQPLTGRPLFATPPQESENDVRLLLTQCSIQSFLFLLTQMRDPHLIKWLDSFTKPTTGPYGEGDKGYNDANGLLLTNTTNTNTNTNTPNESNSVENDKRLSSRLLTYHGIAGLNSTLFPTWDTYFRSLLNEPSTQFIVESNNRLVREFTVDIEPGSICSRILSVREQIANEWVRDLDVVIARGHYIRSAVREMVRRDRGEGGDATTTRGDDDDDDDAAVGNTWVRVPPLSSSVGTSTSAFERMNLSFLEDHSENAPSPLRTGNFDLLVLFATKESVRRVLSRGVAADWTAGGGEEEENAGTTTTRTTLTSASVDFLQSFYDERAEYYFGCKSKRYHMADEFIEQLVTTPARMVTVQQPGGGDVVPVFIDPIFVAEVILKSGSGWRMNGKKWLVRHQWNTRRYVGCSWIG